MKIWYRFNINSFLKNNEYSCSVFGLMSLFDICGLKVLYEQKSNGKHFKMQNKSVLIKCECHSLVSFINGSIGMHIRSSNIFSNTSAIVFEIYLRITHIYFRRKNIRSGKFPNFFPLSSNSIYWKQMTLCRIIDSDFVRVYPLSKSAVQSCTNQLRRNVWIAMNSIVFLHFVGNDRFFDRRYVQDKPLFIRNMIPFWCLFVP